MARSEVVAQPVADIAPELSYRTALASFKLVRETSVIDLTEDDFEFLTGDRLWLVSDRSRARRCVESAVYGALDFIGFPRFPAPVEFIAAAIVNYVSPVNIQLACACMDGAQFTENVITGVERTVSAGELFAHVIRLRAGITHHVDASESASRMTFKGI